jgi:DNA-binding beta-propeller fold protein YncE
MKRREFIKSVGVAGTFSLLGIIPLGGTAGADRRSSRKTGMDRPATGEVGLQGPFDLVFDPSGSLLVSDPPSYRVLRLDSSQNPVPLFGKAGAQPGNLNFPKGIAVDSSGQIFVVDCNNCRIQVFDKKGNLKHVLGSIGSIGGSFATPQGVFVDAEGILYVSDTRNHRIQIFQDYELKAVIGDLGDGEDQFRLPTACATRSNGDVVVLDSKHGLIKVFDKNHNVQRQFRGCGKRPGPVKHAPGHGT